MSADRQFAIGALGVFSLVTRATPGGAPVEPDEAPSIVAMFLNGDATSEGNLDYNNTIEQRTLEGDPPNPGEPIVGRYRHTFNTGTFNADDVVEFVYRTTINGVVRETSSVATFRASFEEMPAFDAS